MYVCIQMTNEINSQKSVFPHSLETSHMVLDIIEGWNVIKCRICEKEQKRSKMLEHFEKHFIPQKEVPITVQEIMALVVPQIEK
jgi:hypothetical protein